MCFQAALRNINLKAEMDKDKKQKQFMFGDPADYAKMSEEERQRLTDEMLGKHRAKLNMQG